MAASDFLIVICSPRTPQSQWVIKEIETFSQLHGHDKILALLIEGEPQDSFPEALRFAKKISLDESGEQIIELKEFEPLAADIRADSPRKMYKLLKKEKLRILSALLGCKYDDLKQRHRERRVRKLTALVAGAAVFFALFGGFSFYQNMKIKAQMNKVLIAQSRYLADASMDLFENGDRRNAIAAALEALPESSTKTNRPYVEEASFALSKALRVYKTQVGFEPDLALEHPSQVNFIHLSPKDEIALTSCQDGFLYVWDALEGILIYKKSTSSPYMDKDQVVFINDNDFLLATETDFSLIDARTGEVKWSQDIMGSKRIFHNDNKSMVALDNNHEIFILNNQGEKLTTIPFESSYDDYISDMDFSYDNRMLLVAQAGGNLSLINIQSEENIGEIKTTYDDLLNACFVGNEYIAISSNKTNEELDLQIDKSILEILAIKDLRPVKSYDFNTFIGDLRYSKPSNKLFFIEDTNVVVVSGETLEIENSFTHGDSVTDYCAFNEQLMVSASTDGTIRFSLLDYLVEDRGMRISHLDRISSLNVGTRAVSFTYYNSQKAYIFNIPKNENSIRLKGHYNFIEHGEFNMQEDKLLTFSNEYENTGFVLPEDGYNDELIGKLIVFDKEKEKPLSNLDVASRINQAHFIHGTDKISIQKNDNHFLTIKENDGSILKEKYFDLVMDGIYSPDRNHIGLILDDQVKVVDSQSLETKLSIPINYFTGKLAFSKDNKKLIISDYNEISIYDIESSKLLWTLDEENTKYACLNNKGDSIALVYDYSLVKIIDLASNKEILSLDDIAIDISSLVFSPQDNEIYIGLENGDLAIYRTDNGDLVETLRDLEGGLKSCIFSDDGSKFATITDRGLTTIRDQNNYKKIAEIDRVFNISSDFTSILSYDLNEALLIPYLDLDDLIKEAKTQLGDFTLSPQSKKQLFIEE